MEEYGVFRGKYSGILQVYKEHIGGTIFHNGRFGSWSIDQPPNLRFKSLTV